MPRLIAPGKGRLGMNKKVLTLTDIERSYLLESLLPDIIAADSHGKTTRRIFLKRLYKKIEAFKCDT